MSNYNLPSDGAEFTEIKEIPLRMLREHYEAQYQFLVGIIRNAGGSIRIPISALTDDPPKRFRLWMDEDTSTRDIVLTVTEVK